MSFWNSFKKNFSSLGGVTGFLVNPIGSLTSSAGSALASNFGHGDIEEQWDLFKNGKTNQANMAMNQANIDYQNRFNQQIWNREDTSYQRTLKDMAAVGMSPLAMSSLNGAGGSANAPNYMFGWSDKGASQAFGEISNIASQLASIKNLTAQNSLIGEQAKKQGLENEFLKDQLNYYRANGFVNGQGGVERGLSTLLGALGSSGSVYSNGEDGLSFNNIADALRQGIKDGSVQKGVTSLLGDVLSPKTGSAAADLGASAVNGIGDFFNGAGSALADTKLGKWFKKLREGDSQYSARGGYFEPKSKDETEKLKDFSKRQAEARKARSGETEKLKDFSKRQAEARKARRGK